MKINEIQTNRRIRIVAPITNSDDSAITVENVLPVGTAGTITYVSKHFINGNADIWVEWDNGCMLSLLTPLDDGKWEYVDEDGFTGSQ